MKNNQLRFHRPLSVLILLSIVTYGVFKWWIIRLYTVVITSLFDTFNLNIDVLIEFSKNNSKGRWNENMIGYLIYYPTYYVLHMMFIYFLFNYNLKARNSLMYGLSSLIGGLLILIIIGKIGGFDSLYNISWISFHNLFGLPLILLAIEGGRVLYNDVRNRIKKIND